MTGRSVVCVGGATVDRTYRAETRFVAGSSNPVTGESGFGGVARNVAENLARLGVPVHLVSAVGADADGAAIVADLERLNIGAAQVASVSARTAVYGALLQPDGDLFAGYADMDIFKALTPERIHAAGALFDAAALVFADCNLPAETLLALMVERGRAGFRLCVDAVSVAKSQRLPADLTGIDMLFLNRDEAQAVLGGTQSELCALASALRARGCGAAIVTGSAEGAALAMSGQCRRFAPEVRPVVSVTGAGDALIAGTVAGLWAGAPLQTALHTGMHLAALTVGSARSVWPELSPALLDTARMQLEQNR